MKKISILLLLLPLLGCTSYDLPDGDPAAGRAAFEEMQCYSCHLVEGETFPEPTADPAVPVVLGSSDNPHPREYLAESIIAPSHRFASPRPEMVASEPPVYVQGEYENIKENSQSRMGDYSEAMTVRQWLDIVAYLEFKQEQE